MGHTRAAFWRMVWELLDCLLYELKCLCGAGTAGAHTRSLLAHDLGAEGCLLRVKLSLVRRDRWGAWDQRVVFYELNCLCRAGTVGAHPRNLLAHDLGAEGCLL